MRRGGLDGACAEPQAVSRTERGGSRDTAGAKLYGLCGALKGRGLEQLDRT